MAIDVACLEQKPLSRRLRRKLRELKNLVALEARLRAENERLQAALAEVQRQRGKKEEKE